MDTQQQQREPYVLVHGYHPHTREYTGPIPAWFSPLEDCYPLPAYGVAIAPPDNTPAASTWRLNEAGDAWDSVPDYRTIPLFSTLNGQPLPPLELGQAAPPDTTPQQPPSLGAHQALAWDAAQQCWMLHPDWRNVPLWRTADATPLLAVLGQHPEQLQATDQPPPADFPLWQHDHWEVDEAAREQAARPPALTVEQRADQARVRRDQHLSMTEWLVQRHRDEIDMAHPTTLSGEQFARLLAYRQTLRDLPTQDGFPDRIIWPEEPAF